MDLPQEQFRFTNNGFGLPMEFVLESDDIPEDEGILGNTIEDCYFIYEGNEIKKLYVLCDSEDDIRVYRSLHLAGFDSENVPEHICEMESELQRLLDSLGNKLVSPLQAFFDENTSIDDIVLLERTSGEHCAFEKATVLDHLETIENVMKTSLLLNKRMVANQFGFHSMQFFYTPDLFMGTMEALHASHMGPVILMQNSVFAWHIKQFANRKSPTV